MTFPVQVIDRQQIPLSILRISVAVIVGVHGWYRTAVAGYMPFGEWLESQGIPIGLVVAIAVTATEVLASICLVLQRLVAPLAVVLIAIYICGVAMIHAKAGWFVVGAGRNGMEFSVLLIASLVTLAVHDWLRWRGR